jgi:hypothetical protein
MPTDPSMPQPMPGQGRCPPGFRPGGGAPGQGGDPCEPIGPGIPTGGFGVGPGWQPVAPGSGPGYPPTAGQAFTALLGAVGGPRIGSSGSDYASQYMDWMKTMLGQ